MKKYLKSIKVLVSIILVFCILSLFIGISSFMHLDSVYKTSKQMYNDSILGIIYLDKLNHLYKDLKVKLRELIIEQSEQGMELLKREIEKDKNNLFQLLENYQTTIFTAKDKQVYIKLRDSFKRYFNLYDNAVILARANRNSEAYKLIISNYNKDLIAELTQILSEHINVNHESAINYKSKNEEKISLIFIKIFISCCFFLIGSLIIGYIIFKKSSAFFINQIFRYSNGKNSVNKKDITYWSFYP